LHVTLLRGIGQGFEVTEMDEAVVACAIDELEARSTDQVEPIAPRVATTAMFRRR
jgi:hypothetical protein